MIVMSEDIITVDGLVKLLPMQWNHIKREYAGIFFGEEARFLGRRYAFTSRGNNAKIEYTENDIQALKDAPIGALVKFRDGSYKHLNTFVYEKIADDEFKRRADLEYEKRIIFAH